MTSMTFNRPIAHRNHKPLSLWASSFAAAVAFAFGMAAHAANVDYVYDDNGRLVGVYAPSGDAAQYVYDAAGNITQINRLTAGTLGIIEFAPKSGPVGAQVTIWGMGFDPTPSLDSVTFNGTAATVTSATPNELVVVVPSGATDGPITVTVAAASVNTTKPFIVLNSGNCGSLATGFSPTIGAATTPVSITGTQFDATTPGANVVQFNESLATVQSATATTLGTTVPNGATSGHLWVSVPPSCNAIDAGDFIVPPSPYLASDIGVTGRLAFNGAGTPFAVAAGKKALFVFDGTINNGAAVYLSASTFPSVTIELRDPTGTVIAASTVTSAQGQTLPYYLRVTGGYSIFINPGSGAAGGATVQVGSPDLAISNSSVAAIIENQDGSYNIPASFTVTNIGGVSAQPYWYDFGYLSANGYLESSTAALSRTGHGTVLAVGDSYTVNQTYVATGFSPGNYTLFLKADGDSGGSPLGNGSLVEASETNNTTAGISLVLPAYPDLAISSPSVGTIAENQNGSYNVPVMFTVTNLTGSPAKPYWSDYGYLSSNGALDATTPFLGSQSHGTQLAAGDSYTVSQTYVTSASPGSYTVFMKADGQSNATTTGAVKESDETNNATSGISVTLPNYPDLAISNPSVGTIAENQNGSYNIPVTFTVTNLTGSPAKPYWSDYGYLSSNGALDATTPFLGSQSHGTQLAAGDSYTVSQTYVTSASPGSYTVFMKADGQSNATTTGAVKESDETNNATSGIAVTLPNYPDLAISNPSVGTIVHNQNGSYSIPVAFTVTNLGTTAAQPYWYDYGYLSSNGVLDASSTSIGYASRATPLAAGDSYTVNQTYTVSGFSAGTYTLFLKADGQSNGTTNGSVKETDESNNATAGIGVTLN